ncbi:MAG TPA: acyl-CoA dehydrogenase family protein [Acidimicrobiales bacterium]|nr:acyl-CoA dehydrogenase family protein [Acidimicrobiales bacterium]
MDATLTDEEALLADTAAKLAADLAAGPADPDRAWAAVRDSGMATIRSADGASAVDAAVCVEAFGRVASEVPLLGPMLAAELLALAGSGAGAAAGTAERTGAAGAAGAGGAVAGDRTTVAVAADLSDVAVLDPATIDPATIDPTGVDPAAAAVGGLAFDARGATSAVAVAGVAGGVVPVLAGIGAGPARSAELSRDLLDLAGPVRVVGDPVDGDRVERWRTLGLVLVCADMVGAMAGALAMAVAYAGQRRQFGRPIGSFQAVQHLCAEQHVSVEAARSATYYAAWAVDGPDAAAGALAARVAKAYVGRVSRQVGEAVLQVHGGIGQTWECDAHVFLRRLLVDRALLGDEHAQEAAVAARIVG